MNILYVVVKKKAPRGSGAIRRSGLVGVGARRKRVTVEKDFQVLYMLKIQPNETGHFLLSAGQDV